MLCNLAGFLEKPRASLLLAAISKATSEGAEVGGGGEHSPAPRGCHGGGEKKPLWCSIMQGLPFKALHLPPH